MIVKRLLIVEDEGIVAADMALRLEQLGYEIAGIAASADEAYRMADSMRPDLVLMDIVLQGPETGISAAARIQAKFGLPIIFVTSHADAATLHEAIGARPFGYVLKPFNERELRAAVEIALYRHATEAKLRKMESWLVTTLLSMGDAVIATDLEGRILLINPVAQALTGWPGTEAIGHPMEDVFSVIDANTREPLSNLVARALVEGFNIGIDEHVALLSRSGGEVSIDDSMAPIRDESGEPTGVVLVFRDSSARVQGVLAMQATAEALEHQVLERTGELVAAHRALGAFTAVVSRDLRAPVLAVKGLSAILSERYGHVLDADGARFLDLLQSRSAKMEGMIDDFLRVARVRQAPLKTETVDGETMVRDIVDALRRQHVGLSFEVTVSPLPRVAGDRSLIRQVWVNLLVNAFKFSSRRAGPTIGVEAALVTSRAGRELVEFRVADNGVGLELGETANLFTLFKRQPNASEFEGRGIGLSIVHAVVERHGGEVSALQRPGGGAVFVFSLPVAAIGAH